MIRLRALCLVALVAGCGDGSARDAAPSSDTSAAVGPASAAEPGAPPFVRDSVGAGASRAAANAAAGIVSVYTSLAEADCRLVEKDEETGATSFRCPGTAGYALLVHDYDARMTVDVVAPDGRTHRLRYSGVVTSAFSTLGPRAEWRMRDGKPMALVIRVNAFENPRTPDRATSYLAVAKVTSREICVTDRIAPAANSNVAARDAADQSGSRSCKHDLAEER